MYKAFAEMVRMVVAVAVLLAAATARGDEATIARPNVLFMMADQQRFDALEAVNPAVQTPSLDRLCREGVRFPFAYAAQALCSPSRASIFSGVYPHTHRVDHNVYKIPDVAADSKYCLTVTWPLLLKRAGYHAGYIGKWHLGEAPSPSFDEWLGYNSLMPHWIGKKQEGVYRSDRETDQAIDFIERNKGRPFVLCVSYYPPHTPYDPPRAFADRYRGKGLEPVEYWGAVTAVDACVGRLLKKLDETDLARRTLVLFTADHGDHFGKRPGGKNKQTAHDESARVPLIMRLPGRFEGGGVRNELVSLVDLMPTVLDVAGVAPPAGLQGYSLAGRGTGAGRRAAVVVENCEYAAKKVEALSRGVGNRRYKLILRDRPLAANGPLREFYDRKHDPAEHANLYGPAQAEHIRPLLDALDEWAAQTGDELGTRLAAACRADLGPAKDKASP